MTDDATVDDRPNQPMHDEKGKFAKGHPPSKPKGALGKWPRKQMAVDIWQKERARRLLDVSTGVSPIDVLLEGMNFHREQYKRLLEEATSAEDKAFRDAVGHIRFAANYAREVAPYLHPKLQAVMVQEAPNHIDIDALSDSQLEDALNARLADLNQPPVPTAPTLIEHQQGEQKGPAAPTSKTAAEHAQARETMLEKRDKYGQEVPMATKVPGLTPLPDPPPTHTLKRSLMRQLESLPEEKQAEFLKMMEEAEGEGGA